MLKYASSDWPFLSAYYVNFPVKSKPSLPAALVQYAARELMTRAESIKVSRQKVHEISTAPLPLSEWKLVCPNSQVEQTHVCDEPAPEMNWMQRLKTSMSARAPKPVSWSEFCAADYAPSQTALVFAPMVLDVSDDVLAIMAVMPKWFSADGVL